MITKNTTANNIHIVENIIREQLDITDEFFNQKPLPVVLIERDQKTVSYLFFAKYFAGNCSSAYNWFQWMKPTPGLFHVQMHTFKAIIKVHWGSKATQG